MTSPDYNANVVLTANVSQFQQAMGAAQTATDQTAKSMGGLLGTYGRLKDAAKQKLVSWDKEAAVTLAGSVAAAALYEKQLSTLSATAAVTGRSMGAMRGAIDSAFGSLPTARGDLVALATQLDQLGVKGPQEMGKLLTTFTKLSAVTGASSSELADSMMQFTKSMGDASAGNVQVVSDQLVSLSKNAGVSASSVLNFSQAIAPIARVSGMTQQQVLGVSTAFSKAGADGYVAGNAFNSILSDITNLSASGSPELAKYSNALGMTTSQFKNLPAATAVAELFSKVNHEGARGITLLNQWGINGVRAITAVQQVAQSGGLDKYLNADQGNVEGALDRGAHASMGGFADALAQTRNQFTLYGTYLGQYVIGPMTAMVRIANSAVQALGLLKPVLAPVLGLVGLAGQGLGMLSSVASPLLMGAYLMRSRTGRSMRAGFRQGRAEMTSTAASEAELSRNRAAGLIAEDAVVPRGMMAGMMYRQSMTAGSLGQRTIFGGEGGRPTGAIIRNVALRMPFMATRGLIDWQRNYLRQASRSGGWDPNPEANGTLGRTFGAGGAALTSSAGVAAASTRFLPLMFRSGPNRVLGQLGQLDVAAGVATRNASLKEATRLNTEMTAQGRAPATEAEHAAVVYARPGTSPAEQESALQRVSANTPAASLAAHMTEEEKAVVGLSTATTEAGARMRAVQARLAELGEELTKNATENGEAAKVSSVLRREITGLIGEMGKLAASTGVASTKILAQAGAMATRTAAPAVMRGIGSMAKMAFNPWVLPMWALPLGMSVYHRVQDRSNETTDTTGKYLNPIQQYNQALGIATTNLVDLSTAADNAARSLDGTKITSATPLKTVAAVTKADRLAAEQQGASKDPLVTAMKPQGEKGLASYLGSLDATSPQVLQQFKLNALAAGFTTPQVQQALTDVAVRGKNPGYGPLGAAAMATQGKGFMSTNISVTGNKEMDAAAGQILRQYQSDQTKFGAPYAAQMNLQRQVGFLADNAIHIGGSELGTTGNVYAPKGAPRPGDPGFDPGKAARSGRYSLLPGINSVPISNPNAKPGTPVHVASGDAHLQRQAVAEHLLDIPELKGSDYKSYEKVLATRDLSLMKPDELRQFIISKVIPATKQGRDFEKTLSGHVGAGGGGGAGGTLNVKDFNTVDQVLRMGGMGTQTQAAVKAQGPLGGWLLSNRAVQASAQTPDDPALFQRGMEAMTGKAMDVGKNFTGASGALEKVKAGIQDSTNATYKLADAAQQYLQTQQQAGIGSMSRGQQGQMFAAQYRQALAQRNSAAPDAGQRFQAAQGNLNQYLQGQNQYMIQMRQTAEQFGTSMSRSEEDFATTRERNYSAFHREMMQGEQDFGIQVARSNRDYNLQMLHNDQDYGRQRSRSVSDFHLQMLRGEQDFGRQMARSQRDFNIQMQRQAQDTANSAYNPFAMVQTTATTDAGTMLQNLRNQNQRLVTQRRELAQARKMGISGQALQQMNLADPQNQQQLDRLIQTLKQDPRLARQINAQISQRVSSSTTLGDSPYNLQASRAQQDFRRQMADAQRDYHLQVERAENDFKRALSRTATDYRVSRERAVEAFKQGMSDSEKDYQRSVDRATKAYDIGVNQMREDYNKQVKRAGQDLNTAMTEINTKFAGSYGKAMQAISSSVAKFAPKAAATMRNNLKVLDPYIKFLGNNAAMTGDSGKNFNAYQPNTMGLNAKGQVGSYTSAGDWHAYKGYVNASEAKGLHRVYNPVTGHEEGGVSTREHVAWVSERNKPEAIIPLDERGARFMVGFHQAVARDLAAIVHTKRGGSDGGITRALVQAMHTSARPGPTNTRASQLVSQVKQDYSTKFTGDIHVTAADYRALLAELDRKTRLHKLANPAHK